MFSKIELLYGQNTIYTMYPEELTVRVKQSLDCQRQDAARELCAGDRTEARREALATAAQTLIVNLPFPHTRGTNRWVELLSLGSDLRLVVTWRPLANIVQIGDGTSPVATMSNIFLRSKCVHFEGDERDDNYGRMEDKDGIMRLFEDLKYEKFTREVANATAGSIDIPVRLNNFRTSSKSMIILLRKLAHVNPGTGEEPDYTNYQTISQFYLEATDGKFFEPVEDKFNRFVQWPEWHIAPSGPKIYEWSWAMEPDDTLNASGGINLGSASNLLLKLQFPAALSGDHELTVIVKEYNVHQASRGDIITSFR
jgi:hypothetical protein